MCYKQAAAYFECWEIFTVKERIGSATAYAEQFSQIAGVTGMVVTKLDGTAKGGVVIAVSNTLKIPVKFVGVGEQMDDLMAFDAHSFVEALI